MNRDDVQLALHVGPGIEWEESSTKIEYESNDLLEPMMEYYERLLGKYAMKILVFSGVSVA